MIFQLAGQISILGRGVLRPPGKAIELLPFFFEGNTVTCAGPELRLFEEDGVDPRVDHPFYHGRLHIVDKGLHRDHIGHVLAMKDSIALLCYLAYPEMVLPIPLSEKIVVVLSPGDAGHEGDGITPVTPALDALFECGALPVVDTIHDGHVRTHIDLRDPGAAGLKSCFLLSQNICR